eukprot:193062_1
MAESMKLYCECGAVSIDGTVKGGASVSNHQHKMKPYPQQQKPKRLMYHGNENHHQAQSGIVNEEILKLIAQQVRMHMQHVAEEQKEVAHQELETSDNDKEARVYVVLHNERMGLPLKHCSDMNSLVSQCKLKMDLNETDELYICTKHDNQLIRVLPDDVLKPGKVYYAKRMMFFVELMVRHLDQEHFRQSVGKLAREHGFGGGIERNSSDITSYRLHLYSPNKTQLQQFLKVTLPKVANISSRCYIACAEEKRERANVFPFRIHAKQNEAGRTDGKNSNPFIEQAESTQSKSIKNYHYYT